MKNRRLTVFLVFSFFAISLVGLNLFTDYLVNAQEE